MEITRSTDGPYDKFVVASDSGKTYEITYAGCGDADPEFVSLWDCSCPAGRHGRDCKHVRTFLANAWRFDEDAEDPCDGISVGADGEVSICETVR